jgi:selenium metabolism protein YedF
MFLKAYSLFLLQSNYPELLPIRITCQVEGYMKNNVDCRGLDCPAPVLQLKDLFEKDAPATMTVLVDNEAARQNVSRFLEYQGFQVSTERLGADFQVVGTRAEGGGVTERSAEAPITQKQATGAKKILIMVGADRIGHGDDGLGGKLLMSFLKTLKEMGPDLWCLVFVNSGVTLTAEGSEAVPILQGLVGAGVQILVCGTCLTHFNILQKKQVGETTNMLDIVTGMQLADSVITI